MVRQLAERFSLTVVPAGTSADEVRSLAPDGVFLSNGPGDPAALAEHVRVIEALIGTVPIFGICLGHQLLATALGGTTYKLPFGHHGSNHPVHDLASGRVEITAQNHNYAVAADSLTRAVVSHVNLNDGVIEGVAAPDERCFSVQYHPEAGPGPHDARYLFDRFDALLRTGRLEAN
jgi:carbamoyl-phosphate synthase small subunit